MSRLIKRPPLWLTSLVAGMVGAFGGAWLEITHESEVLDYLQPVAADAFVMALAAASIQVFWRIGNRCRRFGRASAPLRSLGLLFTASSICSAGFGAGLVALNVFWELNSWNLFSPSASHFVFGLASVAAGVCLGTAGGAALGHLNSLAPTARQLALRASFVSLIVLPIWSAACLPVVRTESLRGHSAGAGLGIVLVGIAIPGAVWLLVAAQMAILRSARPVAALNDGLAEARNPAGE